MIKQLLRVIVAVAVVAVVTSCSVATKTPSYGIGVTESRTVGVDTLTAAQADSMVRADNLPPIDKWEGASLREYESGAQLVYKALVDQASNISYTVKVIKVDGATMYVVKKRAIVR